ncbi:hypothetical protein [Halopelagius longus]|uniref:Uncharacterized protein n=1 Tax=Halopelagius longus TaxID=1236180 RepID=A0A1H1GTR6_9EURY|nr:hypothetical protein [Halopelagius longus]SDR16604.1 hypothetical protein SAMN05216278_3855 [Halopelagius longus]
MSVGPDNPIVNLLFGNVVYVLGLLILTSIFQVTPEAAVQGAFQGTAPSLLNAYLLVGAMLGAVDILVVLTPFLSLAGSSGW